MNESIEYTILFDGYNPTIEEIQIMAKELWDYRKQNMRDSTDRIHEHDNEAEIFCLIGSFLNRLNPEDFAIMRDKKIHLSQDNDKLIITDKTINQIIKKISRIYKVIEIK